MKFQTCPTCYQRISERRVTFSRILVSALIKAYNFATSHHINTVRMADLNLTNSEYANMNYLVRFGLAYKNSDMNAGYYNLPMDRVSDFLQGRWKVAEFYWHNPVTGQNRMSDERIAIHQVKGVTHLMEEIGVKLSQYRPNPIELEKQSLPF